MRAISKIFLLVIALFPISLAAQEQLPVGVGRFAVSGPEGSQFLGKASQDAVVGSLMQQGIPAIALKEVLDPDQLAGPKKIKKESMWVAGRILVVGNTYRVRLKWVDRTGRTGEDYLQVSNLDDLLPGLENYAAQKLKPPKEVPTKKEVKEEKKTVWEKEILPSPPPESPRALNAPVAVPAKTARSRPAETPIGPELKKPVEAAAPAPRATKETAKAPAKSKKEIRPPEIRDYHFISERLPFEVRGLAFGDVDGDGKKEVLLTSQNKLFLYSFEKGKLELLTEYDGGKWDYFVKVYLWPVAGRQNPLIVLTDLRGSSAKGKILNYADGKIFPVVEDIPFQMRVLEKDGEYQLLGSPYSASSTRAKENVYRLVMEGAKVKPVGKVRLPGYTDIFNYQWVKAGPLVKEGVVVMGTSGKLRYFEKKGEDFKKALVSREAYGGSGNYVPVEVKNVFNEVVSDYVSIPAGLNAVNSSGRPEVVVVKNESMVKNIIGRVPIISYGEITRLTLDEMGFVETWTSKKVDGSIQDYLVTTSDGVPQLLVAVRLRDPGLFGEIGRNDSVLLMYNLN